MTGARAQQPGGPGPLEVELFMDYHCPYSWRAVAWLDDLPADAVRVRHRLFALEQVNRDPSATGWQLWTQPLDYVHHQGRQDRRPLAAFLATDVIDRTEPADVARRFRRAVYAVRFETRGDITDPAVLEGAAEAAGAARGRIREALADEAALLPARQRIADDWTAARRDYAVFGVPTLRIGDEQPFYLRLARALEPAAGAAFLEALLAFRAAAPDVLELKLPEPVFTG
ncbi:MAG: DsbA family protein [Chloroflexi bacterium]|nr:DsbA family protein [Chloroflexota bacterium]